MVKVLHVEPLRYDAAARAVIEAVAHVQYAACETQEAFLAALQAAPYEALFTRLGLAVDAAAMAAAPALRWVVTPTTGLDHIDLEEAARRGIEVISLRGETRFLRTIVSTAEHTWALLLALLRKLPAAHRDVLDGRWRREPFLGEELRSKTLGIVGCGRLGTIVAGYGSAFGMRVMVHDHAFASAADAPEGTQVASLDEVLAAADVLSLHLPLNEETAGYLSRERIRAMKRGAVLVNTARGELVDEAALLEALEDGHLAGAAVDVLSGDGRWDGDIPQPHPLAEYARHHGNLILTPHLGGYGRQALRDTRRFIAERFAERTGQAARSATSI